MSSFTPDMMYIPPLRVHSHHLVQHAMSPTSKHVRFKVPGEEDALPALMPSSPSSSSASTLSPRTPPQNVASFPHQYQYIPIHQWSPLVMSSPIYSPPPLAPPPLPASKTPQINCLLDMPAARRFAWDMRRSAEGLITVEQAVQPAVFDPVSGEPLRELTIVNPAFPWKIEITPKTTAEWHDVDRDDPERMFVTVGDVFYLIHKNLHSSTGTAELVGYNLDAIDAARRERELLTGKKGSIRRVDCLMGRTQFAGLSLAVVQLPGKAPGEVWALSIA